MFKKGRSTAIWAIDKKKALILNFKLSGFDDFKISSGWLKKFKICDGIVMVQLNVEGKKMSGNIAVVDSFITGTEKLIIEENLCLEQICNCNKTVLYCKAFPEKL